MRIFTRCAAIVAATAVLGLAGCGKSGTDPVATSSVDQQKLGQYKQCMKNAGVDIPEPDGPKDDTVVKLDPSDPKNMAALSACARFAPPVDRKEAPNAADQEHALKLAECLRRHGIKAKDPATDSPIVELADGATYSQEQLTAAYTICNQEVPAVSHSPGAK